MSRCISRKGEFSDHETLDADFCCLDCGAFDDEAAAIHATRNDAALSRVRDAVDRIDAIAERGLADDYRNAGWNALEEIRGVVAALGKDDA